MSESFEPKYTDYAARVRASLRSQPFMASMLGADATRIEPGLVEISLPTVGDMLQPAGHVHGIVASAVGDSAAGYAAQTLLPDGFDVITVEYKINFLAPGVGDTIVALGTVKRPGSTLSVCTADIYAAVGKERTLFAHLLTTMMAVRLK